MSLNSRLRLARARQANEHACTAFLLHLYHRALSNGTCGDDVVASCLVRAAAVSLHFLPPHRERSGAAHAHPNLLSSLMWSVRQRSLTGPACSVVGMAMSSRSWAPKAVAPTEWNPPRRELAGLLNPHPAPVRPELTATMPANAECPVHVYRPFDARFQRSLGCQGPSALVRSLFVGGSQTPSSRFVSTLCCAEVALFRW